jgi:hypothetical protein
MKRIQDKVKDIVEVRPFRRIRDFTADPEETLEGYRFTDATAELMVKWLEGIAAVQPGSGTAFALAGYRGVGKSHFLATLGALAASPELRGRIQESYVELAAQRLQRRHYSVSHLKRGTHKTLLEELKAAVSRTFPFEKVEELDSFEQILRTAAQKCGETPWILLVDTSADRGARLTRDDGPDLSEISAAAQKLNIFVGIALDDDIAGADGPNAAIARSYSIDYLDQAHLYKVVNTHVFPKHSEKLASVHEIYTYFRTLLPSFRWSEQKFTALYPLHPAILEIAPYVRLYMQDFALLGFASEAGERILGRPANSLIALDEVFDSAESSLRRAEELQEAFAAYDAVNSTVVNKIPVLHRLQAKLILKALLLLSLDGQGATAGEICSSELIFDETEPERVANTVQELLQTFAEAIPDGFRVTGGQEAERRYSFKILGRENLQNALTDAVSKIPQTALLSIVRRVFTERFQNAAVSGPALQEKSTATTLIWRGAERRGLIAWPDLDPSDRANDDEWIDWQVSIEMDGFGVSTAANGHLAHVIWKPAALTSEEIDKLRSYYALTTDAGLREAYADQVRAAVHAHSIAAEKIIGRIFLEDGILVIDGFEYILTDEAQASQDLSEIFSIMLEPLFESRYPAHPYFTRTLAHGDVASIITDLYDNARRELAEVQSLAQTFAFPLGLVRLEGTSFIPESPERLAMLPAVQEVLGIVEEHRQPALDQVYSALRQAPHGLGIESQQMLLTALVAERFIEFVTHSDNRINRRSLDLKIIWGDIVAIARPVGSSASKEHLIKWARLLIPDAGFESFDREADRAALQKGLSKFSAEWADARLLERFATLPDDLLNVGLSQMAARIARSLGTVIERIHSAGEGTLPVEECLERLSEAFGRSEEAFRIQVAEVAQLTAFIDAANLRDEARFYLAGSEATACPEVEDARDRVGRLLREAVSEPSDALNREIRHSFEKFKREYSEHFVSCHNDAMDPPELKSRISGLLKSESWSEFESVAHLDAYDQVQAAEIREMVRSLRQLQCGANTAELVGLRPHCNCGFTLNLSISGAERVSALQDLLEKGSVSFRRRLHADSARFLPAVEDIARHTAESDIRDACEELVKVFKAGEEPSIFTDVQLKIIAAAIGAGPPPRPVPDAQRGGELNGRAHGRPESSTVDELELLNV